ncbi:hypothetical protein CI109_105604 [Kwoniella shandongensis]|uniref:Uncharacterized protein n=1 Tax=Kwoniella shandongensis TaxID=1734106 RepID=A0A5M6C2R8_9TREE|nr:uncharacterized protein CI109_002321 [Kwoniella shandongensis]KAA5529428.1 hypothetical protein CI109_002321 [Kwoniella shandongensis]
MRKGAGISALSRHTTTTSSYSTLSSSISTSQLSSLQTQLESFRNALVSFSIAHRNDIRKDPAFRHQFQKMCAAIGVDPLAGGPAGSGASGSGGGVKGWWNEMIGMGEWEFELAVQVVDICVSTRGENGGLIEMGELIRRVERLRRGGGGAGSGPTGQNNPSKNTSTVTTTSSGVGHNETTITPEDILRSLEILSPLGAGYKLHHPTPSSTFIRTIPKSLDTDQSTLLALAATTGGRLRPREVRLQTGWGEVRVQLALEDCVMREGLGWVDEQGDASGEVWIIAATDFGGS